MSNRSDTPVTSSTSIPSNRRFWIGRLGPVAALVVAVALPAALPVTSASARTRVVADGLNSPRGLDFVSGHSFLIAEAGKGGAGPCAEGPLGRMCVGRTGSLTSVAHGLRDRLVRLSSIALKDGSFAFGPHDVASAASGDLYATIGLGGNRPTRKSFGAEGARLGTLVRLNKGGGLDVVADLLAYEAADDPNNDGVESDPYGLLRLKGRTIVADAAANDLLRVSDGGHVSTLARFHDRMVRTPNGRVAMDAVPTSVVRGPDGAFYVGQLTGFPFPVHGARIYRVERGQKPEVYLRGFTNIIDIAFDRAGNLYVLEIAHNGLSSTTPKGALIKVKPSGHRRVLLRGLRFPTSVAVMGHRRLLLTTCGVCPGAGKVWRFTF
jgi:hypothetical protein